MKNVSPQEEKVMMGRKLFLMTYRKWLNETQKLPRAEVPLPLLLCGTRRLLRDVCIQCSCRRGAHSEVRVIFLSNFYQQRWEAARVMVGLLE